MSIVGVVLTYVLYFFMLLRLARLVLETLQAFARSWRPTGVVLVIAETAYTVTDPPLKLLRRFIPPIRFGSLAFDLSFTLLFVLVWVMIYAVAQL